MYYSVITILTENCLLHSRVLSVRFLYITIIKIPEDLTTRESLHFLLYGFGEFASLSFRFGLSYSTFAYSTPILNKTQIKKDESLKVSIDVKNTSTLEGKEVVQLLYTGFWLEALHVRLKNLKTL